MSTLYENIRNLCSEKNIKPGRMCVDLDLSKSLMTDLKAGRKKTIRADTAQKIADYFGVTVDRVLGAEKAPATEGEGIKYADFELLQAYHDADPRTKEAIRTLLGIKGE